MTVVHTCEMSHMSVKISIIAAKKYYSYCRETLTQTHIHIRNSNSPHTHSLSHTHIHTYTQLTLSPHDHAASHVTHTNESRHTYEMK